MGSVHVHVKVTLAYYEINFIEKVGRGGGC